MYSHKGHDIIYSFNAQESYNMQHFMMKLVQKFKFGHGPHILVSNYTLGEKKVAGECSIFR